MLPCLTVVMLTRRALLLLLLPLLAPAAALACTCSWAGPFTKVALGADLVVLAEVRAYHRHGMDVAVLEVLRGRAPRRLIRVWGDTGGLCRPHVTAFPIGTRWILAVHRSRTPGEGGHALSFCGEHWLQVRGDQAVGRITTPHYGPLSQVAPLAGVRAWVRSGGATPLTAVTLP
jgi:hypothetical protein